MRHRAATAVFTALAWMLVYPAPSLAKPTRTPTRSAVRSQIASRPTFHERVSTRNAVGLRENSNPDSRRSARSTPRLIAVAAHPGPRVVAHVPTADPTMVAAARTLRPAGRVDRPRRAGWINESTVHYSFPSLRETKPSHPPADGAATGDEPAEDNPSALTNVGGVLRSDPHGDAEAPTLNSMEEGTSASALLPSLYDTHGRLVVPPPLYGSHDILIHQNQVADRSNTMS